MKGLFLSKRLKLKTEILGCEQTFVYVVTRTQPGAKIGDEDGCTCAEVVTRDKLNFN